MARQRNCALTHLEPQPLVALLCEHLRNDLVRCHSVTASLLCFDFHPHVREVIVEFVRELPEQFQPPHPAQRAMKMPEQKLDNLLRAVALIAHESICPLEGFCLPTLHFFEFDDMGQERFALTPSRQTFRLNLRQFEVGLLKPSGIGSSALVRSSMAS